MPNRIIKDSIRESESIDALSDKAEIMFYRLITYADDFGTFKADPILLNSALFPRKNYKPDQIKKWINEISREGMIVFYSSADGKPYAYFVTWKNHQQQRAVKPKNPLPEDRNGDLYASIDDVLEHSNDIRNHMISDDITCPRIRIRIRNRNPIQVDNDYCGEPSSDISPPQPDPILKIPLIPKDGEFDVLQKDIDEWQVSYPGIDVLLTLKHLRQWNIDNPTRRKTRGGIRKHISGWLAKEQNRSPGKGQQKGDQISDALRIFRENHRTAMQGAQPDIEPGAD